MNRNLKSLAVLPPALLLSAAASAAPCTAPTAGCTEWVAMPEAKNALVYRSYPLATRNDAITRAVVIVHGGSRDAHTNFRHVVGAAFLAGALDDTVIVSPRFASNEEALGAPSGENAVAAARAAPRDSLAANELNWISQFGNRHWNAGGVAANAKVTSYEVIDEILRKLARKDMFPKLKAIVVAGHSSGGQFVSRYQMVNRVHEQLGVKVSYVVANPGAYTYLDALRPTEGALPQNITVSLSNVVPVAAKPRTAFVAYPDARNCTAFNTWPYGIQNRVAYAAGTSDEDIKRHATERPTTFVLGELDFLPLVNFDVSCSAMAQGQSRLGRGLAFSRYLRESYAAKHNAIVINGCGHHTRCMLTSDEMLPLLFPAGV